MARMTGKVDAGGLGPLFGTASTAIDRLPRTANDLQPAAICESAGLS